MKTTYSLLFVSGLCLLAVPVQATVTMPRVFADHMVLQRDMPVAVWGWADAGEKVTVQFGKQSKTAVPDATGRWQVALDAMPANDIAQEMTIAGTNTIVIRDVLVGEVWLCAGQSNMNTQTLENPKEILDREMRDAELPTLRMFAGGTTLGPTVQKDLPSGQWVACTRNMALQYSGVAFFAGREIHNSLKVPVGLIKSVCGGSKCESWTSIEALQDDPAYQKTVKPFWDKKLAEYPAALQKYNDETLPNWEKAAAQAKADGKPEPKKPGPPFYGPESSHTPASLFNHMVAPLVGLSIRGVMWYQGESNASSPRESKDYRTLFPTMITDWRKRWQRPDLPFLFVQIANIRAVQTQPVESSPWALFRESQAMALALPHTGMVTAIDINDEPDNIHPKNKYNVGRRLGFMALSKVYDKSIPYAGPTFERMTITDNKVRLHFTHTDGGLKTRDGGPVKGFAIAGQTGKFVWADVVVDGKTLVLSSPKLNAPTKVRYGWAWNPIGNLDNGFGLPAFPFRTDLEQRLPAGYVAINCGSCEVENFGDDDHFTNGKWAGPGMITNEIDMTAANDKAAPEAVYQTIHWGMTAYTVPGLVANASYIVRLHFAESVMKGIGQRVFDVSINGSPALRDFDIIKQAGGQFKAIVQDIPATASAQNDIVINFISKTNLPLICGIEVIPLSVFGAKGAKN